VVGGKKSPFVRKCSPLSDLVTYCKNEKVPFKTFENFSEILATLKDIVAGKIGVKDVGGGNDA
jgi:2-hydroxy-3-keto-5-methylthiopentenyl-1-phosphate phosphatase